MTNSPSVSPIIEVDFGMIYPLTGWLCSVCFQPAQVQEPGWFFCKPHAKEFNHGWGKTIAVMNREWKEANP